jgi:hypothetical protein
MLSIFGYLQIGFLSGEIVSQSRKRPYGFMGTASSVSARVSAVRTNKDGAVLAFGMNT